jgi:DNA polymerase III psi subunit
VAVGRSAVQAKLSPRVSKLQHILAVLDERKECSRLVYLDTDIVITSLSQNVFDSSFFSTAAAGRAVALTHDLQWNATDLDPRPASRYQTGVIFMQRSPLLVELLQAWLGQRKSERLEGSVARLRATGSAGKQQSAVSVADSEPWDSDQWLLGRLLIAQPTYAAAISTLKPRHVYNAFPVHRVGLRSSGSSSGNTTERVSAMQRVRQQKEDAAAALWQQIGRPQGDEVQGESLLVHFAGESSIFCFLS